MGPGPWAGKGRHTGGRWTPSRAGLTVDEWAPRRGPRRPSDPPTEETPHRRQGAVEGASNRVPRRGKEREPPSSVTDVQKGNRQGLHSQTLGAPDLRALLWTKEARAPPPRTAPPPLLHPRDGRASFLRGSDPLTLPFGQGGTDSPDEPHPIDSFNQ